MNESRTIYHSSYLQYVPAWRRPRHVLAVVAVRGFEPKQQLDRAIFGTKTNIVIVRVCACVEMCARRNACVC